MYTFAVLLGVVIAASGGFMIFKARKKSIVLEKYELENRSSDGEIFFDGLESSRIHTSEKGLCKFLTIIGSIIGLVGVTLLVAGLNL